MIANAEYMGGIETATMAPAATTATMTAIATETEIDIGRETGIGIGTDTTVTGESRGVMEREIAIEMYRR